MGVATRGEACGRERPVMSAYLVKIALVVAMTHGFRALSRTIGPRWGGLALGLPCSSAIALVGGGCERGVDYSVAMAEASLIGLVGAVAVPLAYAGAIGRGWRIPWPTALAVGAYLAAATVAGRLCTPGGGASLGVSAFAVLAATWLATRIAVTHASEWRGSDASTPRVIAIRTMVPVACLVASTAMGDVSGPGGAGLMSTFPGVTLTVLSLTHLEAGPAEAIRMARALPAGNLGMVAFLAVFRFACPEIGPAWAAAIGYLAALAMLGLVARIGDLGAGGVGRLAPWPRVGRKLLPAAEPLAA